MALAVLGGGGYGAYQVAFGGGDGSDGAQDAEVAAAREQVQKFLDAWAENKPALAGKFTDTPAGAESLIRSVMTNLKPERAELVAAAGEKRDSGEVSVPFRVRLGIPSAGELAYNSRASVVKRSGTWTVAFGTPLVHPELAPGQTLALKSSGRRAPVLDAEGDDLRAPSLRGLVDGDGKGISGLEARYDKELSGGGSGRAVVIADRASGRPVTDLAPTGEGRRKGGREGTPIRTTIDPKVQEAAADALEGVGKNAAIVAVEPSTGHVLAVANKPGTGLNRGLAGQYPPGSTFKVVTAAALLKSGLGPGDAAACPKFAEVDGQRFENQNRFTLPAGSTFRDSFAHSCNTFFVGARDRVAGSVLPETAKAFGIGGHWDTGAGGYSGSVPVPRTDNELAAAALGQARVEASPLVMASIAATVKDGTFKQPVLVPGQVKNRHAAPSRLGPEVLSGLREMMRATVTEGAGHALRGVPGEPHAKTGTAEYGTAKPPRTHAWMIGYQGRDDLAWSVFLEDGGSGGSDAGPVAARFLRNLA
ncbi:penicillin-binding transpeptidase domain-containing protein [Streptomyces monticola]|uniref:Penicillin-binding transpeptidase domain-containing protein n=1 Tax=Streptomyces monticola TaxID=2666263 RepID=A0ABW2JJ37_9ACTN